jgi:NAD(P)-dependent dehydrogenase (short-subunit alcohol dehydrogenase family)
VAAVAAGALGWAAWRTLRMADLRGEVALITGGSRGLGLALAEEFGRRGARLAICSRDENELRLARERLAARGFEALAIRCDVSVREDVRAMVVQVTDHYGRIDVLVNVAGIISAGPLRAQTLADLESAMDTMFWGTVYPTWDILPQMLARHSGRIVNITSIGGKVSVPHLLSYSAAKFAATGFSEGLYAELKKEGITVTTVAPWLMRTGSYINALMKGQHELEYSLFSLLDNLPLLSVSARRAARQIVAATRRGQPELMVGFQSKLATRVHGVMPGTTLRVLALLNRFLPGATGTPEEIEARRGVACETALTRSPLLALGHQAARRYNEVAPAEEQPQRYTEIAQQPGDLQPSGTP